MHVVFLLVSIVMLSPGASRNRHLIHGGWFDLRNIMRALAGLGGEAAYNIGIIS